MSAANPAEGTLFVADDSDGEPTVWVETDLPARPIALLRKNEIISFPAVADSAANRLWAGIVEWAEPKMTIVEVSRPSQEERERALDLAEALIARQIEAGNSTDQPLYVRPDDRLEMTLKAAAFLLGETR